MTGQPKAIYIMASHPEAVALRRRYPHLAWRIFDVHQQLLGLRVDNIWVGDGVNRHHHRIRCRLEPGGRIRRLP